jgi:hypothetical protein
MSYNIPCLCKTLLTNVANRLKADDLRHYGNFLNGAPELLGATRSYWELHVTNSGATRSYWEPHVTDSGATRSYWELHVTGLGATRSYWELHVTNSGATRVPYQTQVFGFGLDLV